MTGNAGGGFAGSQSRAAIRRGPSHRAGRRPLHVGSAMDRAGATDSCGGGVGVRGGVYGAISRSG